MKSTSLDTQVPRLTGVKVPAAASPQLLVAVGAAVGVIVLRTGGVAHGRLRSLGASGTAHGRRASSTLLVMQQRCHDLVLRRRAVLRWRKVDARRAPRCHLQSHLCHRVRCAARRCSVHGALTEPDGSLLIPTKLTRIRIFFNALLRQADGHCTFGGAVSHVLFKITRPSMVTSAVRHIDTISHAISRRRSYLRLLKTEKVKH